MIKRLVWKENDLYSVKLSDQVFTVCQSLTRTYVAFYSIYRSEDKWKDVRLSKNDLLFIVPVIPKGIKKGLYRKITNEIKPLSNIQIPDFWLTTIHSPQFDNGADLVKIDQAIGDKGLENQIIKYRLDWDKDRDVIEKYEFASFMVYPQLFERLIICFNEGKNVDPKKHKVFTGKDPYGVYEYPREVKNVGVEVKRAIYSQP